MENYEIWLTDDAGVRMALLKDLAFLSYTRSISSLGTINFGLPFNIFSKTFIPWFRPDWRVEVWRKVDYGHPLRREDVFLLRKPHVYVRQDGMQMIQFYGRNGIDLLYRRIVAQRAGTAWALKTDLIDDMMKEIVREQMLYGSVLDEDGVADNTRAYPQNEFTVEADSGRGPSAQLGFEGKKVFDVLKSLKAMSFQLNADSSANERIYFDVVPVGLGNAASGSPLGWNFITKAGLYGNDRTSDKEFSLENENISRPEYSIDHLDEVNAVYVLGGGRGETQIIEEVNDANRTGASRWNRREGSASSSNQTTSAALQDVGSAALEKGKPLELLPLVFLNTPGGKRTPRSLYGLDWDLGDLVRVNYANKQFHVEINIIYVSVDENGREEITGRNEVNNA